MIIQYLNKLLNKLQTIEYRMNVEKVRYADVNDEYKKNMVISVIFLFLNVSNIVVSIIFGHDLQILNALIFVIMLILMCCSSRLWNFELCPEKIVIRKFVNIQIIIRFIMIVSLFGVLEYPEAYYMLVICLTMLDGLLNILIKMRCRNIVVENSKSIFKDHITDWDVRNVDKIAESVSYGVCLLYIIGLTISMEADILAVLGIKICIFIGVIYIVNNKIAAAYESMHIYRKKAVVINVFLILGGVINCLEILFEQYCIKDISVLLGILCMFPLCNEYASIANRIKMIRYEQKYEKENKDL